MSKFRILSEVSFRNQSLKIRQEYAEKKLVYYTSISQEEDFPAKLIYEDDKNRSIFLSLEELGKYLQSKSINIFELANHKTNDLAEFVSFFLGLGRAIKNHPLYEPLKQNYEIYDLDKYLPKIESKYLIFIVSITRIHKIFIG